MTDALEKVMSRLIEGEIDKLVLRTTRYDDGGRPACAQAILTGRNGAQFLGMLRPHDKALERALSDMDRGGTDHEIRILLEGK